MKYIADLHIHSLFSRATSKKSDLAGLAAWARVKGIQVIGTGDFTHPGWFSMLKKDLLPAEPGFFRLRDKNPPPALAGITPQPIDCRFVLTAEISSIYKRHGKVRKVHNIIFAPDFEAVEKLNARLAGIGNIESDGRPILGLDSRNLLEIVLECVPDGFLVPAHIWTPWFSLFGSRSGFDHIEECFDDLTGHIFALETGLSSDPDMNRLVSALDRYTLISNSDCHSPGKLGREANLFDTDFNFFAMRDALKEPAAGGFQGTVEFFPEEGKYHFDGHRNCEICLDPEETRQRQGVCPVCDRPLTIGVAYRVLELADRRVPFYPENSPAVHSLIPLAEVIGEIMRRGPATKGVMAQYGRLISMFGSEFNLLLRTPVAEISQRYSPLLGEAVRRIRAGEVIKMPGYDGRFGTIKVFAEGEMAAFAGQDSLFVDKKTARRKKKPSSPDYSLFQNNSAVPQQPVADKKSGLNPEQAAAVACAAARISVTAGPGTGKTFTLVARLVKLLADEQIMPERIAAITFTNRAAAEVRERLMKEAGAAAAAVFVGTFHAFCLHWLRNDNPGLAVVGEDGRLLLLRRLFPDSSRAERLAQRTAISQYFEEISSTAGMLRQDAADRRLPPEVGRYLDELRRGNGIDLEEVIPAFVGRLAFDNVLLRQVTDRVAYLFVDEFQDVNASQYELVKIIARQADIFVIGDPDQAIYGFRGGRPEFFLRFIDEFDAENLFLTRNYRSTPAIIKAAAAVIGHNPGPTGRDRPVLIPRLKQRTKIERYTAPSPEAEAEFVVRRIEELMGGISNFSINSGRGGGENGAADKSFRDFAVLYRLSKQARILSDALTGRGIPHQVVDSAPFFMKPGVRGLYYWLLVAADTADAAEYTALLRYVKGIGAATVNRLENEISLNDADFSATAGKIVSTGRAAAVLNRLRQALARFREETAAHGLAPALPAVLSFLEIDGKQAEALRFLELAGAFGRDLAAFAGYLRKNVRGMVYDEGAEVVSLMTMHASKGLEFPVVFITGLEEGVVPCDLAGMSSDAAEERRLFYVALTRARERAVLLSAAGRMIYGRIRQYAASRFLADIPPRFLETAAAAPVKKRKNTAVQLKLF